MYVGAGLTILSTVIFFATKGQLADSLADGNPTATRVTVDRAVDRLQAREIVRVVLGVGLWIWMAVKNGDGRRWARVVATAFGMVNLIAFAFALALVASNGGDDGGGNNLVDYTLPYLILAGVGGVLAVVTLVQLYRADSSLYYDETARWDAALTLRGH
jgi:hypothetical protein